MCYNCLFIMSLCVNNITINPWDHNVFSVGVKEICSLFGMVESSAKLLFANPLKLDNIVCPNSRIKVLWGLPSMETPAPLLSQTWAGPIYKLVQYSQINVLLLRK